MTLAGDIVRYDGGDWDLTYEGDTSPDDWITDDPAIWSSDDAWRQM